MWRDQPRALASLTAWRISSTSSSVRRTGSGWCGEGGAWRESRGSRGSRGSVSRGNESRASRGSPVNRRSRSASTCFSCSASDAAGPMSQQPLHATFCFIVDGLTVDPKLALERTYAAATAACYFLFYFTMDLLQALTSP